MVRIQQGQVTEIGLSLGVTRGARALHHWPDITRETEEFLGTNSVSTICTSATAKAPDEAEAEGVTTEQIIDSLLSKVVVP